MGRLYCAGTGHTVRLGGVLMVSLFCKEFAYKDEGGRKLKHWASTLKDEDNPCLVLYEILP